MGLDMYLVRKVYIGANYEHNEAEGIIAIKTRGRQIPLDLNKITYIEETAGYWRKANQIHKWFVDNIQNGNDDCGQYDVTIDELKELLILCKEVKEKAILKRAKIQNGTQLKDGKWVPIYIDGMEIKNAEEISHILPTQEGYFFGNTDYNEFYMEDIDNTIEIIENQIKREEELKQIGVFTYMQYTSSW